MCFVGWAYISAPVKEFSEITPDNSLWNKQNRNQWYRKRNVATEYFVHRQIFQYQLAVCVQLWLSWLLRLLQQQQQNYAEQILKSYHKLSVSIPHCGALRDINMKNNEIEM